MLFLFQAKKIVLSLQEIQQTFAIFRAEHVDFQFIYTDGSKGNGHTGNAIFAEGIANLEGRLSDDTSVFIAELHAIFIALRLIEHHNIRRTCICSDSRSALQCILNPTYKDYLHFQIINLHQQLIDQGAHIKFLWIPAHSGINGNEKADEGAKRALNLPHITQVNSNHHSIRSSTNQCVKRYWEKKWTEDVKRTQLHDIKTKIGTWSSSSRKNRLEEKTLARLRIGHTYLTHSFIFKQQPRPQCTRCDSQLTVRHILLHCRKVERERQPLKSYCRTHNIPLTLQNVLGDEHPELIEQLLVFLKRTNIIKQL